MEKHSPEERVDAKPNTSTSMAPASTFEIIDLQPFLQPIPLTPEKNFKMDDLQKSLDDLSFIPSPLPPTTLQGDEDHLYSSYLSGAMSFED